VNLAVFIVHPGSRQDRASASRVHVVARRAYLLIRFARVCRHVASLIVVAVALVVAETMGNAVGR
jgi:hypothetical protein